MANKEHLKILGRGVEAWNEWRRANPKVEPDLEGADLQGTDLVRASLANANLSGANLSGADLLGANIAVSRLFGTTLIGATLSSSDLTRANLINANLMDAVLDHAILEEANLVDTNFSGANFAGATLAGAILVDTQFNGTHLSATRGLAKCHHVGPSHLDIQTIERSDPLPEAFLRGVGWPERLIEYLPTLMGGPPIEYYACFISYSSIDKAFARRLHDQLQGRGVRCYLDEKDARVGDDIAEWIDRRVRRVDKLLLCASKDSLTSAWVDEEIATARERERSEGKRIIIPLNLDGYLLDEMAYRGPHSALLRRRLAADFTGWASDNAKFEASFEAVMRALEAEEADSTD
jgi:uncharacterized protein YjbI with pentapeptide repeats